MNIKEALFWKNGKNHLNVYGCKYCILLIITKIEGQQYSFNKIEMLL